MNSINAVLIQQLKTNSGPLGPLVLGQKGKFTSLLPHNYEPSVGLNVHLTSYKCGLQILCHIYRSHHFLSPINHCLW